MTFRKGNGAMCLLFAFLIIAAGVFSGCSTEKASGPAGPCDVSDQKPGDIKKPLEINFGKKVKLLGINMDKLPQNKLKVVYYWQPMEDLGPFKQVFVHFTDGAKILLQGDHVFCENNTYSDIKGKFVKESYTIDIPEPARGKALDFKIGIYNSEDKTAPRLIIEPKGAVPADDLDTRAIIEKVNL